MARTLHEQTDGDEERHEQQTERQRGLWDDRGILADWLRWSSSLSIVMTGQAKIASARQVAIVTRSEKMSNALRARGGNSEITTSMRIWRPAQPTGPAPRKTQPIIRNSIASSAHDSDRERK